MTVLKSLALDETVLKVTETVWPVPGALEVPLHQDTVSPLLENAGSCMGVN